LATASCWWSGQSGSPATRRQVNPGVSHRFPGSTTVTVKAIDAATGWLELEDANGISAWITRSYVAQVLAGGPPPTGLCYPVGTWNLEHFHEGVNRGFPENTQGGPSYPSRTANDLTAIAAAIRDIVAARILILNEIMGEERQVEGEIQSRSDELDALLSHLAHRSSTSLRGLATPSASRFSTTRGTFASAPPRRSRSRRPWSRARTSSLEIR
jgi:hypothetical protein